MDDRDLADGNAEALRNELAERGLVPLALRLGAKPEDADLHIDDLCCQIIRRNLAVPRNLRIPLHADA